MFLQKNHKSLTKESSDDRIIRSSHSQMLCKCSLKFCRIHRKYRVGFSFLMKLQAEKFLKIKKKKQLCRYLVLNRVAGWTYSIKIKLLKNLHFFIAPLITKAKLFLTFPHCAFIRNWKIACILLILYLMSGLVLMVYEKNLKILRDKDFWSYLLTWMDILSQFRAVAGSILC